MISMNKEMKTKSKSFDVEARERNIWARAFRNLESLALQKSKTSIHVNMYDKE